MSYSIEMSSHFYSQAMARTENDSVYRWVNDLRRKGYIVPFEDPYAAGDDYDPRDMLTTILGPGTKKRITHFNRCLPADRADHSMTFYFTHYESEDGIMICRLHRTDRIRRNARIGPYMYTCVDTISVSNIEMAKLLGGALKETFDALQDKITSTGITPQHGVIVDNRNGKFNIKLNDSSLALRVSRLGSEKKPYFTGRLYRKMDNSGKAWCGELLLLPGYYVDAFIEITRRQLNQTEYSAVRQPASLQQHACNTIRSQTDRVDELPLPTAVKAYLM